MSETALKLLVTTLVLLWLIVTFYSSTAALVKDLCSQVRQLSYVARCAVFTGLLLATLIGGAKGILPQHVIISLIEKVATFFSGTTAESALDIEWDYLVNPESLPELTSNQCVSGLALVSVSTNPAPAYWAIGDLPTNMVAHVNPAWLRYGIAEDGYWINSTDENNVKEWSYCIGGQEVESLFISSAGTISISVPAGASASHTMPDESGLSILAPLWGPFGVVPALGSCVWSAATTNGGLLVCWNNVLIGRSTNNIASFQAELHWNGDVEFRYALPDNFITSDHVIGVQHAGGGESVTLGGGNSALSVKAFSLFFRGFTPFPYGEWDLDQDGLPANEEVYLYGTSPTHFDSDFDGISDSNEVANARNPLNPDENNNGIVDGLEMDFYGEYDPDDIDPQDGLSYGYKIANGLDPTRDCSIDSDGDGFTDWQEELAGTDPNNGQSNPEEYQGESLLTDITITLRYPLPAPVMLTIGPRKIMMRDTGSWVLTLPQGVAHDISLSATQPCSLKLGAELSSDRALLLDTSGVFTVSHPAHNTSAPSVLSTAATDDAVYISGRKQCGIFARPQVEIQTSLFCFHSSHPKTVKAVVRPELEGAYQWSWIGDDYISSPIGRETSIMWSGTGSSANLGISFLASGAVEPVFDNRSIYKCSHIDDQESTDDDDYDPQPIDGWCSVHSRWHSVCRSLNLDPGACSVGNSGPDPESDPESGFPANAGRPLAVNNDDDDGDGVLDLYDTDGVIGDDDFIKIYPFSPYTGGCCPCPSHNPSASTRATRISCSENLRTWGDAAKTTQCTSVGRGEAVYVEGIRASTYIGGDKIIWGWSEDGETYARTNTYTIFSLRIFGDLNFDNIINSSDYAGVQNLTEHGWLIPVASNSFRKVLLKNDVNFTGNFILSLTGDARVRVWATATPSANDTPLLITGQSVTNGVDGANFAGYPESVIYIEATDSGTATLSYNYIGIGEHALGLECKAVLSITAVKIDFIEVSCDKFAASGSFGDNPVCFEGQKLDFGNPTEPPPMWWQPGTYTNPASTVFQVHYKYIKDINDEPDDFEIQLKAYITPSLPERLLNINWWRTADSPSSGSFNKTDELEVKYQNPTEGGLYKFRITLDYGAWAVVRSDAWVLLPKSGGEVSGWLASEVAQVINRSENWKINVYATADSHGVDRDEFLEKAWISIASYDFDYQGIAGNPTRRYSFTDDDRPAGHVPIDFPGMRGLKGDGDWNEPSYATLCGMPVSRAKINNALYAVWGRKLGYSKNALKTGANYNAIKRKLWDDPTSQNAVDFGCDMHDECVYGTDVASVITKQRAKDIQTPDTAEGLNDVNLWPDSTNASSFWLPVMPIDYNSLTNAPDVRGRLFGGD